MELDQKSAASEEAGGAEEAAAEAAAAFSCGISLIILKSKRNTTGPVCVDLTKHIADIRAMGIECYHENIHATCLWRKGGFSEDELKMFVRFRKSWLRNKERPVHASEGGTCTFGVSERWGSSSNYIRGELEEFIVAARECLAPQLGCDLSSQRPPHVSLRIH